MSNNSQFSLLQIRHIHFVLIVYLLQWIIMAVLLYVVYYSGLSWLCYCMLFITLEYHGCVIVCCLLHWSIMAVLLYVVYYIGLSWLCYCMLFITLDYHGCVIVCCRMVWYSRVIHHCVISVERVSRSSSSGPSNKPV